MVIADFRAAFPEFSDAAKYPDAQLTFWASVAEKMVKSDVWQDMYENGVFLYVAHEITLAAQNKKAATVGGPPGQQGGIANTKTVGSVTVGYDSQVSSEKDAGFWNLTNYGKQFIRYARLFGAQAIQL